MAALWLVAVTAPIVVVYLAVKAKLRKMKDILVKAATQHMTVKIAIANTISLPTVDQAKAGKITKATLCELISMRDAGEVTCQEILLTYLRNARVYGQHFKVISHEYIQSALSQAQQCDLILSRKQAHGPLLGIPFSVKECICSKDAPFTYGCARLANNFQMDDTVVVKGLKDAGGILLFKGSMGMLGASAETENRIVGRAENPWDRERTPGGSSGGDAVLVLTRAVAFALGSDVGGSVRYPAAYCGLHGLKPTSTRLSSWGPVIKSGFPPLFSAWGFMTHSTEDLALLYSVAFQATPDPLVPPLHWNQELYTTQRKFKIGYVSDSEYWPVADCCKRVVLDSVSVLRSLGHELVEFSLFSLEEIMSSCWKIFLSSNEGAARLGDELPLWSFFSIGWRRLMPSPIISLFYHLNLPRKDTMMWKALYENRYHNYVHNVAFIENVKTRYFQAMQEQGLDAIIVPYPFPACLHGMHGWNNYSTIYTMLFNLLDVPVGTIPVDVVRESEQYYTPKQDEFIQSTERIMKNSSGLPLSVQIVGKRYQDEICLNIMKQIEGKMPFTQLPPGLERLI